MNSNQISLYMTSRDMFEEKDAFLCEFDLLNLFLFSSLREPVYTQPRNHILNTLHLQSCSFDMSEEW